MKHTRLRSATFEVRAMRQRLLRTIRDARHPPARFRPSPAGEPVPATRELARSETRLRAKVDDDVTLTDGKIANLRVAVRALDGLVVPADATFSLWRQLGKPSAKRGFVRGRELREGCLVPTIGGGLCQLSNAVYACALDAGFEILERHAHSQRVPGSQAAIDRDATLFWNYIDLRFRAKQSFVIRAALSSAELVITFAATSARTAGTSDANPKPPRVTIDLDSLAAPIGTCTTCDTSDCHRHEPGDRARLTSPGRTAFLLDGMWPEFDAYVREHAGPSDLARIPIDGRRFRVARYAWTTTAFDDVEEYRAIALRRTLRSRLGSRAESGGARQRVALAEAARLARSYSTNVPHDVRHVVVAQTLLPFVWQTGMLGGRTFDVLMSAPPMTEIHSLLDAGARAHPESPTFADFRAATNLVEAERQALAAARSVITPHAGIAAAFGVRGIELPWAAGAPAAPPAERGDAIVFAGPTLGRSGAYELRNAARALDRPIVLTSERDLESTGFWDGIAIERMTFAAALARAAVVVSPAYVTSQPRRELAAVAAGIPTIVTPACGLRPSPLASVVPIGDADALARAIERILAESLRDDL